MNSFFFCNKSILQPDRLVANDFIQCRKVAEHILDKLLGEGSSNLPGGGDADPTSPTSNGTTVDQIELTCNDQVILITANKYLNYLTDIIAGIGSVYGFENSEAFHMEIFYRLNFIL